MKHSITYATHTMVVSRWCPTDKELTYCFNQSYGNSSGRMNVSFANCRLFIKLKFTNNGKIPC